jgi:sigma-B regulation protein RsbU (phosphoserine phosphatase)
MTPPPAVRRGVFRTLPGRLLILSSLLLAALWLAAAVVALPLVVQIFHRVVSFAFIVSLLWVLATGIARNRRKLLWRVRRKLVLTYVLLGVVPVALVALFAMAGGVVLYNNVAAYVFHQGLGEIVEEVDQAALTAAAEIGRSPGATSDVLARKIANLAPRYPGLSLAAVPTAPGRTEAPVTAGPWRHALVPAVVPNWVLARGFKGVLAMGGPGAAVEDTLLIRAAVSTPSGDAVVIADVPIDIDVIARLRDRTGARILAVTVAAPAGTPGETVLPQPAASGQALFRRTVAFMDVVDWRTGTAVPATVHLDAPIGGLYQRVASAQSAPAGPLVGSFFLIFLVAIGVLFLIIQGAALTWGTVFARQITHAVHELFLGTEHVQRGDYAYRVRIESRDQLGDLADSFNRMSASIEHLRQIEREKDRMEDDLRIARDIQKSLLPSHVPAMPGLSLADLCEPAKEVGGDYYDFFELGPRQLGVLVADVSGKGTSAALYMAELKGLVLALSHIHRSPRALLIQMNHLLADHLDNRSFITMTYAVVDLDARTITHARAGHTPLLIVSDGKGEVIVPNGMVLGLRLPGASERFETMLEEDTRSLAPGDVVVLYTDGVTEAMNADGDLFGDAALARIVTAHRDLDAPGIRERVVREVKAFVGDADPHDDMTMIVLKVTGEGGIG